MFTIYSHVIKILFCIYFLLTQTIFCFNEQSTKLIVSKSIILIFIYQQIVYSRIFKKIYIEYFDINQNDFDVFDHYFVYIDVKKIDYKIELKINHFFYCSKNNENRKNVNHEICRFH